MNLNSVPLNALLSNIFHQNANIVATCKESPFGCSLTAHVSHGGAGLGTSCVIVHGKQGLYNRRRQWHTTFLNDTVKLHKHGGVAAFKLQKH